MTRSNSYEKEREYIVWHQSQIVIKKTFAERNNTKQRNL